MERVAGLLWLGFRGWILVVEAEDLIGSKVLVQNLLFLIDKNDALGELVKDLLPDPNLQKLAL